MLFDLDYRDFSPNGYGDLTMRVRPLETRALQDIMRAMQKYQKDFGGNDKGGFDLFTDSELRNLSEKIFTGHVTDIRNMDIRINGEQRAAVVSDLHVYGQFLPLCTIILVHLFSISMLTDTEGKNSSGPSPNTSQMDESESPNN